MATHSRPQAKGSSGGTGLETMEEAGQEAANEEHERGCQAGGSNTDTNNADQHYNSYRRAAPDDTPLRTLNPTPDLGYAQSKRTNASPPAAHPESTYTPRHSLGATPPPLHTARTTPSRKPHAHTAHMHDTIRQSTVNPLTRRQTAATLVPPPPARAPPPHTTRLDASPRLRRCTCQPLISPTKPADSAPTMAHHTLHTPDHHKRGHELPTARWEPNDSHLPIKTERPPISTISPANDNAGIPVTTARNCFNTTRRTRGSQRSASPPPPNSTAPHDAPLTLLTPSTTPPPPSTTPRPPTEPYPSSPPPRHAGGEATSPPIPPIPPHPCDSLRNAQQPHSIPSTTAAATTYWPLRHTPTHT